MSGLVVGWAFSRAGLTPTQKLVLVALADCADDKGGNCYPSQALLADKTALAERTVRGALSELEDRRLIVREHQALGEGRGRRPDLYALAVGGLREHIERFDQPATDDDQPAVIAGKCEVTNRQPTHDQPAPAAASSETSENRQVLSLTTPPEENERSNPLLDETKQQPVAHTRARAGAREAGPKPVTYRGRTVPRPVVVDAERLLEVFAEQTGSRIGARSGDGRPSQALKQIVGALIERPGATADAWERGIRSMIAEPPAWIEGRFMIGHLFGPRAAEHTLARGRQDQTAVTAAPQRGLSADEWGAIAQRLRAEEAAA